MIKSPRGLLKYSKEGPLTSNFLLFHKIRHMHLKRQISWVGSKADVHTESKKRNVAPEGITIPMLQTQISSAEPGQKRSDDILCGLQWPALPLWAFSPDQSRTSSVTILIILPASMQVGLPLETRQHPGSPGPSKMMLTVAGTHRPWALGREGCGGLCTGDRGGVTGNVGPWKTEKEEKGWGFLGPGNKKDSDTEKQAGQV